MRKKLIRFLISSLVISLVLGLMGNFALAAKKELSPYEWSKLSNEDKLKYKTIVIRSCEGGGSWMEEKEWKRAEVAFNEIMDTGDTLTPTQMYSKALFEYLHPNVKIKHIDFNVWGPVEYRMAAIAGGTAPSAYQIWSGGGPLAFVEKGLVADITELIKDWDITPYLKKNFWGVWKYAWKEGHCYGVPEGWLSERVIFFRKDWCKEAGIFNEKGEAGPSDNWSWDDFRDIAVKLTDVKKKRWGFTYGPTASTEGNQMAHELALSFGVFEPFYFCTPDKSGKYTWKVTPTPQLIKALQFLRDLRFKYNCMLTGVEKVASKGYPTDFRSGRAGMAWYVTMTGLQDTFLKPHLFSPTIPTKDIIGVAFFPKGPHIKTYISPNSMIIGFDPTLNKEELKAAFEWRDWVYIGMGREIMLRRDADLLPTYPSGTFPPGSWLARQLTSIYPLRRKIPGIPSVTEYTPPRYIEVDKVIRRTPAIPEPFEYGLELCRFSGPPEELPAMNSLFQALVTNPDTTVEDELNKTADILNKTVYNYKIKGDKEKMKTYVDALVKFYKENHPEFYKSKDFKEQLSYFKVW